VRLPRMPTLRGRAEGPSLLWDSAREPAGADRQGRPTRGTLYPLRPCRYSQAFERRREGPDDGAGHLAARAATTRAENLAGWRRTSFALHRLRECPAEERAYF